MFEKEDSIEDNEAQEVPGRLKTGENLLPKQIYNLGFHRRKGVKIWSKEQSA